MITKKNVVEALKEVEDPEIHIDVWTLELIYNIEIKDNAINITMTFTSPMCPYGPILLDDIKRKLKELKGVKEVNIEVVFEPLWEPSEELRAIMGI